MKTEPIRSTDSWAELLATAGNSLNAINAATVGSMKGLLGSPLPDADIVAELRRVAAAHDRLMGR